MVHVNSLTDDYYYYDEETYEMIGKESGKRYKLGQTVDVEVVGTDRLQRTIDFEINEKDEDLEDGKG